MSEIRGLWVKEYCDFDKLTVEKIVLPVLEPKQVRIRVQAAGVSFAANLVVAGKYQRKPPFESYHLLSHCYLVSVNLTI